MLEDIPAPGSSGQVIKSDGTNWTSGADAGLPAAGADGQLLTSDGTNWASEAAAAGGAWTAKSSGTLTTSSGLEVTGITGTTMIFLNLKQSAVHGSVILRTSSDGGSSYDDNGSHYYRNNWDFMDDDSSPAYNKGYLSRVLLHGARGSSNPAGDYISMAVRIIRPQDSFSFTNILSEYSGIANSGGGDKGYHGHSGSHRASQAIVNAFQIKAYSGTITGTYEIIHL